MGEPRNLTVVNNPFQRHMRSNGGHPVGDVAFQAPLPLSSAQANPNLLTSFQGVFHFSWPTGHLVALEGPPTATRLASRRWISLIYVAAGEIYLQLPNAQFQCAAGDCLFIPEEAARWESNAYSVVCLMFAPQQLAAMLKSLRSPELSWYASHNWDFSKPACRKASEGDVEACLLTTLQHVLQITSELVIRHPILVSRLGISEQLGLLTALLACPSLTEPLLAHQPEPKAGGVDEAIDELTSYMRTHLSEPLNLSILEKYSHYSRRSLQYAFRHRFGCTITQWIRTQRLDQAYQYLKTCTPGDSVASIAKTCGYRSVSLFSIEFQNRFHVKPSVLLRESKHRE